MPVGTSWNIRTDIGLMGTYRNIVLFLLYFYCADSEELVWGLEESHWGAIGTWVDQGATR